MNNPREKLPEGDAVLFISTTTNPRPSKAGFYAGDNPHFFRFGSEVPMDEVTGWITAPDFTQDIPETVATAAHSGTSFTPEVRGRAVVSEWIRVMGDKFERLAGLCDTPEKWTKFCELWKVFHEGAKRRKLDHLRSRSGMVSTMIAGPANFNTARAEKKNAAEHRRLTEYLEFFDRWEKRFMRELVPASRPIMSGDADACERLRDEIEDAESLQERMKDANAAIRKHAKAGADTQRAALLELGFTEGQVTKLLTPDCFGGLGFPACTITNNGANLLRLKKRLAHLEKTKATPVQELDCVNAKFEDNPPENRVRLFFPGRPDAATIADLKKSGFRWTPSLGCWQAFRNNSSYHAARRLAGEIVKPAAVAA